ncbi:SRPBCC family protein [Pleomorphovibrio marinus]|uniref:SRPBCC family protein n=1 Tax=Pleomorphovibrio marinus TaxID=2164132 RepID=UPI000E0C5BF9|nr:SRPBCC family protein [Pleomorphovibrio marinus]
MKIENSIHIAAPPEREYAFFGNMAVNYLKWHPDHLMFKWIKGKGLSEGNKAYLIAD